MHISRHYRAILSYCLHSSQIRQNHNLIFISERNTSAAKNYTLKGTQLSSNT